MAPPPSPPTELLEWTESVTGQPVVAVRPMDRWRPTWIVDVGTGSQRRRLVVKTPRAPAAVVARSTMLRSYGLDREGDALEALQGSDVPVPDLLGRWPQQALLIGMVEGTGQVTALPPSQRRAAMRDYGTILARLHRIDHLAPLVSRLAAVPGLEDLPGPLAAVVEDRRSVRTALDPDPLIELGLHWLGERVPPPVPIRLLHGDAGPDQFMVAGGAVAAVLDWELAHLGDSASDLGYARFREALYPTGSYMDLLEGYADGGGDLRSRASIEWYTAVAALVMLVGINPSVQRPLAANPEAAQRLWWDALARMALCQVLNEAKGRPAPVPGPGGRPHAQAAQVRRLLAQYPVGVEGAAAQSRARLEEALGRLDEIGAGRPPAVTAAVPHELGEALEQLTEDAAAGVWALAPLAALDTWTDRAPAGWRDRLHQPVVPAVPQQPWGAARTADDRRGTARPR